MILLLIITVCSAGGYLAGAHLEKRKKQNMTAAVRRLEEFRSAKTITEALKLLNGILEKYPDAGNKMKLREHISRLAPAREEIHKVAEDFKILTQRYPECRLEDDFLDRLNVLVERAWAVKKAYEGSLFEFERRFIAVLTVAKASADSAMAEYTLVVMLTGSGGWINTDAGSHYELAKDYADRLLSEPGEWRALNKRRQTSHDKE